MTKYRIEQKKDGLPMRELEYDTATGTFITIFTNSTLISRTIPEVLNFFSIMDAVIKHINLWNQDSFEVTEIVV